MPELAATDSSATIESLQSGYKTVIGAAQQQEELIAALLSLAKGQRDLIDSETFDLAPIAHEVTFSQLRQFEQRALSIDTNIESAMVIGDPQLIEQLIWNLVDNAILHNTPGGRVHIATVTQHGLGVIAVSNDGPIIPTAELERLFRPFERLEPGRRNHRNGHGLGLGLSIVDAIATAHGAIIAARSRPQGGLSVEVSFPPTTHSSFDAAKTEATSKPPAIIDPVFGSELHA